MTDGQMCHMSLAQLNNSWTIGYQEMQIGLYKTNRLGCQCFSPDMISKIIKKKEIMIRVSSKQLFPNELVLSRLLPLEITPMIRFLRKILTKDRFLWNLLLTVQKFGN